MPESARRGRRRLLMAGVYVALYLLTMIGIFSSQPQFLGIPLWYWWGGLIILLLIPVNYLFVRYCWPTDEQAQGDGARHG